MEPALRRYIKTEDIEWNVALPGFPKLLTDVVIPASVLGRPVVMVYESDAKNTAAIRRLAVHRFRSHFVLFKGMPEHRFAVYVLIMLEKLLKAQANEICELEFSLVAV